MFDAEKWDNLINGLERGKSRMELLKQAWEEADLEGDYFYRMRYRDLYLTDAVFYDDVMLAYVVFPEFLKLYDEYNHTLGQVDFTYSVLWDYKWITGESGEFYQISISQAEHLLEDQKIRYQSNGYSLAEYYKCRYGFYYNIDRKKASEEFQKFKECRRDAMSDCLACERHFMIDYYLTMNDEKEAIAQAKDLFSGALTCHQVPTVTYGKFMMWYLMKQDYEKAEEYGKKLRVNMMRKKIYCELIGEVLLLYSLTNLSAALAYFKKNYQWHQNNKNPYYKYYFAMAATMLWKNLRNKKTIRMKLSGDFPIYNEDGIYQMNDLYEHYYKEATELAWKFDTRNGTEYFVEMLESVLNGNEIKQWV